MTSPMTSGAGPLTHRGEAGAGSKDISGRNYATGTADRRALHWQPALRDAVLAALTEFLDARCVTALADSGVDIAGNVVRDLLSDGKCLRSTFLYLGWLTGAAPTQAAVRAAASLELLHAFALMQDDVMDESHTRRGRPSAHRAMQHWHRGRRLPGLSSRFGESAAVLLGDLCLVWGEQMLRESGVDAAALTRVWPRYDAMRVELAVGQFADLVNDSARLPSLEDVLDIARRKSGNYTVRRPLEIGAALAGGDDRLLSALGDYGGAVGEAFQLRDDLLGVFGTPETTGKPAGTDLAARKATTVVAAAYQLATGGQRNRLRAYMTADHLSPGDIASWRALIAETGTVDWIEELIERRLAWALHRLDSASLHSDVRSSLVSMAAACAERVA
ncbi:geranylgeranyl diphosphate synthase type I [Mycolicibacterium iranicum]|uniref:Geranylgeranyl diphosphate synthase type I n=1 Tax=Mycolicibacterium iranicum TaxID=912594 RepID=A0A839Q3V3_MYCIR|nr:polyprenyl synthetase family protein [Mycolicibacterium iranicum]MBB2990938.1 geranylgeranyl diphosphate synthase type I [Mycolicibacterium iranicum]